jgi:uncharacterized membrane protein
MAGTVAVPATATAPVSPSPLARARRLSVVRFDFVGVTVAVCLFCMSLTPSLLPRPWYLQGLLSGVLTATGYAVGVAMGWTLRRAIGRGNHLVGPVGWRRAWWVLGCAGGVLAALFLVQGSRWQRDVHLLMGEPAPAEFGYLGVPVLAAAVFASFVALARLVRAASRALGRLFGRWIPAAAARVLAVVGVVVLLVALLQGVVANGLMAAANAGFESINGQTFGDVTQPTGTTVSGSPDSLVPWASLGRWGQNFVARAPTVAELSRFSGRPATPPVRVYVGLHSAPTLPDQADLAVRELERTGAFQRAVLCVITTTGTGWVDQRSLVPLEYLYNGDTALVALQYSYLPSVISYLADQDRVRTAGRELFDAVYARWSRLLAGQRPKLLVFGESLGAAGAEAAFSGVDDLRNRTDGALLVGPPNSSRLWGDFVAGRDPGSGEALPTYQHGATVRFAGQLADLAAPAASWLAPRVVYLQHASDPVVWSSPRLILHRPDWLAEPRGRDVLPAMHWYPFVTFWQLSVDLVFANDAPPGHGHDYRGEAVDAWALIVPPPGWTADRTAALRTRLGAG